MIIVVLSKKGWQENDECYNRKAVLQQSYKGRQIRLSWERWTLNLFVINRHAGNGNGQHVWTDIEPRYRKLGIPYAACVSTTPEQAEEQVKAHLVTYPYADVIVIGGDGTIHRMLPLLAGTHATLGIIPAGSGNDTARGFGIPSEPIGALEVMLAGERRLIDLIKAHDRWTLTAIANGFDAAVADIVNRSVYKRWCNLLKIGPVAYLIGIIHMLFTYRPTNVEINIDGEKSQYRNVWLTAISNVNSYGGGIRICPAARADDGKLDICIVHNCSRFTFIRLLPTVFSGKHVKLRYVAMKRGSIIDVKSSQSIVSIGDGERIGTTPFTACIHPGKLNIYAPYVDSK